MRSGFLDTLTRIVMLVLAGMVSLSIIGAIAAMSEGGGPSGFTVATEPAPVPAEPERARPSEAPEGGGVRRTDSGAGPGGAAAAAPPVADSPGAKRLEAIAYVLFALAGLAALIALILWRAVAELRRAADAIERLAEGERTR